MDAQHGGASASPSAKVNAPENVAAKRAGRELTMMAACDEPVAKPDLGARLNSNHARELPRMVGRGPP